MTVEDGFVPTPPSVADYVTMCLFAEAPSADDRILFPGAGTGSLAAAVQRYCSVRNLPCPEGVAIDISPDRLATLEDHVSMDQPSVPPLSSRCVSRLRATYSSTRYTGPRQVSMDLETVVGSFLEHPPDGEFDYIIANPPYSRYNTLDPDRRGRYRKQYDSAVGQFPLYMPFVEQMQRLLAPDGTLAFLAPASYLVGSNAVKFRKQLRRDTLEQLILLPEQVFPTCKVQPVLTTLSADPSLGRDGHFWVEGILYRSRVREMLRDVGVRGEDRQTEALARYSDQQDALESHLRRQQSRQGQDGGYNVERIPAQYRPGDSHQSDLGSWVDD